jgi:hypothetical protein
MSARMSSFVLPHVELSTGQCKFESVWSFSGPANNHVGCTFDARVCPFTAHRQQEYDAHAVAVLAIVPHIRAAFRHRRPSRCWQAARGPFCTGLARFPTTGAAAPWRRMRHGSVSQGAQLSRCPLRSLRKLIPTAAQQQQQLLRVHSTRVLPRPERARIVAAGRALLTLALQLLWLPAHIASLPAPRRHRYAGRTRCPRSLGAARR